MTEKPRNGQSVWATGFANGVIIHIDWHAKEVIVKFHNGDVEEVFEMHQFDSFNERLNQWQIHL